MTEYLATVKSQVPSAEPKIFKKKKSDHMKKIWKIPAVDHLRKKLKYR